ncbi:NCS2 family permease, partial [Citrobacter freundii]|uniref:NCS2 family permease n=1 Tax=Citrobacter freundii TaxID=546 RepID=UPI0021C8DEE0
MAAPNSSAGWLERLFKLSDNKTTFRTEVLAGVTTFLTMCYIIIVNPLILSETGMDHGAVFVATCLAAAIGCLVMGIIANYPIALAPGMGLNAYFTYSVCMAVFVSGLVFLAISFFKIREAIVNAIPMSLKFAIGGGIGLFLALVALKNAGIIVANQATLVGLGDIKQPTVLLALFGFLMIVVLHHLKVRGAI